MEKELRRNQNTLIMLGLGVILFGLWSVVKILFKYTLDQSQFQKMVSLFKQSIDADSTVMVSDKFVAFFIYFVTILFMLIIVFFRLYIGLSAIKEGQGRKRGKGYLYLFFAALLAVANVGAVTGTIQSFFSPAFEVYDSFIDRISALVADITSLYTLVGLIIASFKVKRLTKQLKNRN